MLCGLVNLRASDDLSRGGRTIWVLWDEELLGGSWDLVRLQREETTRIVTVFLTLAAKSDGPWGRPVASRRLQGVLGGSGRSCGFPGCVANEMMISTTVEATAPLSGAIGPPMRAQLWLPSRRTSQNQR